MPILTPVESVKRILVSRTDGLGDVICTLPIAVAIKQILPEAEVAFMVSPYTAALVRRIREVDQVLTLTELRRGLHLMKVYKPDAIIFARPEFQLALEAVLARVDVRIGTGYRWYSGLFTRWVYDHRRKGEHHEAWYGVNMLSPLLGGQLPQVRLPELPVLPQAADEARARLGELGVTGEYMVIHPGGRGSAGLYAPEKYAAVAGALLGAYPDMTVLVSAGPNEEALARKAIEGIGARGRVRMVNNLSLDGLSELLRGAKLFLGSSSGPAHLAALVNAPVVALYPGLPPMWPARWHPLAGRVATLVPHPDEPSDGYCDAKTAPENCVSRIASGRVIGSCLKMLEGKGVGEEDYIGG